MSAAAVLIKATLTAAKDGIQCGREHADTHIRSHAKIQMITIGYAMDNIRTGSE